MRGLCLPQKITNGSFSPNTFAILVSRWWPGSALWEVLRRLLTVCRCYVHLFFSNIWNCRQGSYQVEHIRPLKYHKMYFCCRTQHLFCGVSSVGVDMRYIRNSGINYQLYISADFFLNVQKFKEEMFYRLMPVVPTRWRYNIMSCHLALYIFYGRTGSCVRCWAII